MFHEILASIQCFVVPELLTALSAFKAIFYFSVIFILQLILKFCYFYYFNSDIFFSILVRGFYLSIFFPCLSHVVYNISRVQHSVRKRKASFIQC